MGGVLIRHWILYKWKSTICKEIQLIVLGILRISSARILDNNKNCNNNRQIIYLHTLEKRTMYNSMLKTQCYGSIKCEMDMQGKLISCSFLAVSNCLKRGLSILYIRSKGNRKEINCPSVYAVRSATRSLDKPATYSSLPKARCEVAEGVEGDLICNYQNQWNISKS